MMTNEEIREMAIDRFMAIPRVILHPNGQCFNHPDGDMLHAAYTMQQAREIIDDVMLSCAAAWTDNPANDTPPQ